MLDKLNKVVNELPGFKWLNGNKTVVAGGLGAVAFVTKFGLPLLLTPATAAVAVSTALVFEIASGLFGIWGLTGKAIKSKLKG